MKCSRIRTALLTFILGMMSVPFFNALFDKWNEIPINVPVVESESPIVCNIYPTERFPMQRSGGGGSGVEEEEIIGTKAKKASLKSCCK